MKICLRAHDLGKSTSKDLAEKIHNLGFDGVQLAINKAIIGQTAQPGTLNDDLASEIKNDFNSLGIEVAMIGSYFNPVHSNKALVENNIMKFKEHLKYGKKMGTHYIGSETGSFNDDKWTYHPLNRTEEAYQEVKRIFGELVDYAKDVDVNIAIEGADGHCIYHPKQLKRLIDDINNDHMFVTVDIYNWLNINNHQDHTLIFDECLDLFGDKIVIFHLKDYIIKDQQLVKVGLGLGLMNLDYMLTRIKEDNPNSYLIFEGVMPDDIVSSLELVKKYVK